MSQKYWERMLTHAGVTDFYVSLMMDCYPHTNGENFLFGDMRSWFEYGDFEMLSDEYETHIWSGILKRDQLEEFLQAYDFSEENALFVEEECLSLLDSDVRLVTGLEFAIPLQKEDIEKVTILIHPDIFGLGPEEFRYVTAPLSE